jgi:hypothetical protein
MELGTAFRALRPRAAPTRDVNPDHCAAHGKFRRSIICAHSTIRQGVGGPSSGFFGTRDINVFRVLGGVGQDGDTPVQDFHEAAADHQGLLSCAPLHPQLAGLQHRQQGRVVRQNADLAVSGGGYHHVGVFLQDHPFGGDQFKM